MNDQTDLTRKFQQLYFEEFGEQLSEREALDRLTRLVNVLRVLLTEPLWDSPKGIAITRNSPLDDARGGDTLKASPANISSSGPAP